MPCVLIRLQEIGDTRFLVICQVRKIERERDKQEECRCSRHDQDVFGLQTTDPEHSRPDHKDHNAGTQIGLKQDPGDDSEGDEKAAPDRQPIIDPLDVGGEIACQRQNYGNF